MNITIHDDVVQGSDEWHAMRCGLLTASEMKLVITPSKLQIAKNDKCRAHAYELAAQRITGYVEPQYITDAMMRGHEDEIHAADLYAEKYAPVQECGFITQDFVGGMVLGFSPDRLVGDDGLIEIKSRSQKYQMQTVSNDEVPVEHIPQVQTGMLISGRKWCDYVSYCSGMPMYVKRVHACEETQEKLLAAAYEFEKSVQNIIDSYATNAVGLYPTERVIEQEMFA